MPKNRRWILAKRPTGAVTDDCFQLVQEDVPEPQKDGDIVVRNLVLSCDPTQRGWISRDTYMPAIPLGDVIRAGAAGKVVASKSPAFAVGDVVTGLFGWQDYA